MLRITDSGDHRITSKSGSDYALLGLLPHLRIASLRIVFRRPWIWNIPEWDVPSTKGITAILRNTNTGQDVYVLFDFQSSTTRQQMLYVTLSPTNFSGKHGISRGFSQCFTLKVLPSRPAILEISFSTKLSHPYQTLLQNHIKNVTVSSSGLNIAFHQCEGKPRLSNFDIYE